MTQLRNIPLSVPNLRGNEASYVLDAIEQEWVSTGGAYITRFEDVFDHYLNVQGSVAVQSGTAALHLAMLECGVTRGDLVIAPTLTFIAAINPIRYQGADPVFMDCDDSLCMDANKLGQYLSDECEHRGDALFDKQLNKPIKAILVVHVFGNLADMEAIMQLAQHYRLPVIEDATEALGSRFTAGVYAGKMAGSIGDIGAFSFNGNKIITTGGGGMLVAQSEEHAAHMRHLSTQAKADTLYFIHDAIGYNYRMTNLQAALGVAQMEQLEVFIETKRALYKKYIECGIPLLPFREKTRPNYWFFSHQTKNRDSLMQYLSGKGIQARPIWKLNHQQTPYIQCRAFAIAAALRYYNDVINLPCSSNLTMDEVVHVAEEVKAFGG